MNKLITRFICLGGVFLLFSCNSIESDEFKKEDLYGAWLGNLYIYVFTKDYRLVIPNPDSKKEKGCIYKSTYTLDMKDNIKLDGWKIRKDHEGLYIDYTPYWLGFIPTDNIAIARKISEKEAIELLKKGKITNAQILNIPIENPKDNKTTPDNSAPEIFDKL